MPQYFPAIITLFALLLYVATAIAVAVARGKYKIPAPATTGDINFERVFRVQMNTQENLIIFLPVLWLFSEYVSPLWAGILGIVWLIGRTDYAFSYIWQAEARDRGFATAISAFAVLAIGAGVGIALKMLV